MKQDKKVELLAPAGNVEAFYGAIHAGADAVYLGGSRFGARAYADNFAEKEMISCIRYAHLFGRKVYLTVNTLIKEAELPELYDYLLPFYEAGLDGVIIQDIGVFTYIKRHFPGIELHVSTQMTITGKYGAALLKDMGASRIVPARELSLNEIQEMKEATGLEIETFVHGAMCYCYSGQCLFSSIIGGRSGNRGRCAQPCRLPYRVQSSKGTTEELYPLSLKDMCTIEHIPELIEAGIDSFKIEGRMKKPEYAAGVTAIYRKYIDNYYASGEQVKNFKVSKEDLSRLSKLYIRSERQDGYYHKHNGKDMITLTNPAYSGSDEAILQQIRSTYLEKSPKLPISIYGNFTVGEEASVTLMLEELSVTVAGDVVQNALKQPITRENVEKQLGKLGDSVFQAEHMEIVLSDEAFYPLKAMNELRRKAVVLMEDAFIQRNNLPCHREDAIAPELGTELQDGDTPASINRKVMDACAEEKTQDIMKRSMKASRKKGLHISIRTTEQLLAVVKFGQKRKLQQNNQYSNAIARLYIDGDLFYKNCEYIIKQLEGLNCLKNNIMKRDSQEDVFEDLEVIISLPTILRNKDEDYLQKLLQLSREHESLIKGFRIPSMEALGYLKAVPYSGRLYADVGFYIWNRDCLQEWAKDLDGYCLPLELKSGEQRILLTDNLSCEKVFYGRIPMMVTANCVARTTSGCRKGTEENVVQLIDRYQKQFPVVLNCTHCMNIIYNSVPLSLHGEWSKWQSRAAMRLDFTIESKQETLEILDFFYELYQGTGAVNGRYQLPYKEYTTGHEKRGVE